MGKDEKPKEKRDNEENYGDEMKKKIAKRAGVKKTRK
jgi:hypothetical protein